MTSAAALAQGGAEREYVYVGSVYSDHLRGFRVDAVTGALSPLGSVPLVEPNALVGDAARASLYVATFEGKLARFNIDPSSGSLASTPPVTSPGLPEGGAALHPALPFLYVADGFSDRIRAYSVDQPCCIVYLGAAVVGSNNFAVAVHPSGRFLYATTSHDFIGPNTSHLWGYSIDTTTGLLTPLNGSPWLEGSNKRTYSLAIEPGGRYLYAVNSTTNEITAYAIDGASGALARLPTAPFPSGGTYPDQLAITASGRFLYVSNLVSDTVTGFSIGPDGVLTPVPGSPYSAGDPRGIVVGGGDRFVYVASEADAELRAFTIDAASGALAPMAGEPFPALGLPRSIARVAFPWPPSVLSVDDVEVTEGQAGSVNAAFTVRRAVTLDSSIAVGYATVAGTAQAPSDFTAVSGTLTFPNGTATRQVVVPVHGDLVDEPDEFFSLALASPIGAVFADDRGFAHVRDDDGAAIRLAALDRTADVVGDLRAQPGPFADEDLYVLNREPWSSHEIVVDGASGDLGDAGPSLELVSPDFSTVVPSSPVGAGFARTLRLENDLATPKMDYVRVRSLGCALDCGPDDTYRIRLRETTGFIPRFNQAGGQVTVVVLQNLANAPRTAHLSYWGANGVRLAGTAVALGPRASATIPTPAAASGTPGSITVSHDGSFGDLAGKAVALEPASGLSFDTPLTTRPR